MIVKCRILIAEKESPLIPALQIGLEQAGFEVAVAQDGGEAWQLLQQGAFDLLITDRHMPRSARDELCQRMQKDSRLANLPTVLFTGKEMTMGQEWSWGERRWMEVIPKSFNLQEVVAVVKNRLLAASASDPNCVAQNWWLRHHCLLVNPPTEASSATT
jgi:DNA-binding response OmpR family regulator